MKTNNKVYLQGWNEGSGNYKRLVIDADCKTFQTITTNDNLIIGKDKYNVFIETTKIRGLNPNTIQYVGSYYYIDDKSVYFFGSYNDLNDCRVKGANPRFLKLLDTYPWAYDDKHIIYGHNISEINDINEFKILDNNWGQTSNKIFFKGRVLSGADVKTFEVIDDEKGKDKNFTYKYGKIVK
ncbi:DKNYY domain-containing protein [Hymenobacter rubidus]|uniref:DKNYY domain-containing protein n=1 Tax=Hymenobacter rubidus TaxID=1441626 RepID=UPI00191D2CB8|nr:DKNYY domain-containing protein [Hymenobacter rubidus]